jgi:hypothetical protein
MFECTVTVGNEEQSSYFGVSLPHAMELALFRHAFLPWCKSSTLSDDENKGRMSHKGNARQQEWQSVRRAMVERAIAQVRAAAARRRLNEAVTESRTNMIADSVWQDRVA